MNAETPFLPVDHDMMSATLQSSLRRFRAEPVIARSYNEEGDKAFQLGSFTLYFDSGSRRFCIDMASSAPDAGNPVQLDNSFAPHEWRSAVAYLVSLWAAEQANSVNQLLKDGVAALVGQAAR